MKKILGIFPILGSERNDAAITNVWAKKLEEYLEKKHIENMTVDKRTLQQNKALHKYFELLAEELNNAGLDMRHVLKEEVSIPWSKDTIKEWIWKPIMNAQLIKKSTTEMTTDEVSKVYETVNRLLGDKFGVHVPFPSDEESMLRSYEE